MEIKGKLVSAQIGDRQIQEDDIVIIRKKSPIKIATAKFEDETIAPGFDFVTQKVANGVQHDGCGKSSDNRGSVVMLKKHVRGFSLDENDLGGKFRTSLRDDSPRVNVVLRSPNAGRKPTRATGKGTLLLASPLWERKVSTLGNQGAFSSTPGRRQARAIICGEASVSAIFFSWFFVLEFCI